MRKQDESTDVDDFVLVTRGLSASGGAVDLRRNLAAVRIKQAYYGVVVVEQGGTFDVLEP